MCSRYSGSCCFIPYDSVTACSFRFGLVYIRFQQCFQHCVNLLLLAELSVWGSVWIVYIQITASFPSPNDLQTVIFAKLGETYWCGRVQNFVSCHCYKSCHQIRACIIWCKAVELHIDLSYLKENGREIGKENNLMLEYIAFERIGVLEIKLSWCWQIMGFWFKHG